MSTELFIKAALAENGMPVSAGPLSRSYTADEKFLAAARAENGLPISAGPALGASQKTIDPRFPQLIRDLFKLVADFEKLFPGRPFTPDGHMVGSLAECYAEYYYDLKLHPCSHPGHDASHARCEVEIKATQGDRVALRSGPEQLLVFRLLKNGSFEEVYNGPGAPVWATVENRAKPSNGQYQVGLATLRRLMESVPEEQRLKRLRS
jgi:hypothetical protein